MNFVGDATFKHQNPTPKTLLWPPQYNPYLMTFMVYWSKLACIQMTLLKQQKLHRMEM
jgi:hypothetical protein